MFHVDELGILRCEAFLNLEWVEHGFQTRESTHLPNGFSYATLKQTHSTTIVDATGKAGLLGEGDALIASSAGTLVTIRTADCIPLLIADPETRVVAAVHAGWRGVVAGIVPRSIAELRRRFESDPTNMVVAIGPCIREDAFEVGVEVAEQFQNLFPERPDLDRKARVDLAEAARRQLLESGIARHHVFDCGSCSFRERELFHSYRRDQEASGRMTAFIGIRPPSL